MHEPLLADTVARLKSERQEHLLQWWDELNDDRRRELLQQISEIDFALLRHLSDEGAKDTSHSADSPAARAQRAKAPAPLIRLPQSPADRAARDMAAQRGREMLESGEVGVILVAGGQGTRLDFPYPKGMFPIGPATGKPLFQLFAEQILARSRAAGVRIPYYIMTSEATHQDTVEFFEQHAYFGLRPDDVAFFQQGTMPAIDAANGRVLLADKCRVSASPDGHGGMLAALERAGLLADMERRGIEYLFYHQVDNPTVVICDPVFLGYHALHESEMSSKVVAKRSAEERMGVVVQVDGHTQIIEYSDLPVELAQETTADGDLRFWAGSTAIHVFDRRFLQRLLNDNHSLPFHVARKHVPHVNAQGEVVTPDVSEPPNGYKFERFIFDALPCARCALVVEADRRQEFNPVKNKFGNDSPETARAALSALYADWLTAAGAELDDRENIEISPLTALDAQEVRKKIDAGVDVGQLIEPR